MAEMTTPDYVLRFAEAIAPGNAELLLTGGTEEAILNAATDTISDLRERNAELAAQRLEADDRAYYEGRIAELEAALNALYEHTKNNRQICGLNERARAVLNKEV